MSKKQKGSKNPVPRIGRTDKEGYQFPQFKPSKKFEKQFPKAAKRREAAIYKQRPPAGKRERLSWIPQPPIDTRDYFEKLKDLAGFKPRQIELPLGNEIDGAAILFNMYGEDEAAEILNTDLDILLKAIQGGQLNRLETARIKEGYNHIRRDEDLISEYDIDIDKLDDYTATLTDSVSSMRKDNADLFRQLIADGDVDLEKYERASLLLSDLSIPNTEYLSTILDEWSYQQEHGKPSTVRDRDGNLIKRKMFEINDIFDNYFDDTENGVSIWDIDESTFWAWFREIFY